MPSGIDLILADHQWVDELFTEFADTGDGTVVGQILDALTAHDDAEHAALYPFVGAILGDDRVLARVADAHRDIKAQIGIVKTHEGPALVAAVDTLRSLVDAHVADEERSILPALGESATAAQLEALGARILQAKQRGG